MIDQSTLFSLLDHYGYFGLFGLLVLGIAGIPLPDEALLTFVGMLVRQGHMNFFLSLVAAFVGSCFGISLSYVLGRFVGREVITRFGRFLHLTEEKLQRAEQYMERYGRFALFFGYFVPGVRHLTALTAGFSQMQKRIFAPYAFAGALVWCFTFLLLGQAVGHEIHRIEHMIYSFRYWIGSLVVLSLAAPLIWRSLRRRARVQGQPDDRKET
jgi:membrane protein DedA with SNARE-associated domain